MSIRRRLTENRKLISWFDEFWSCVDRSVIQAYMKTLDVSALGDLSEYTIQPTIFTVRPLPATMGHLLHGTHPNKWGAFSYCVLESSDVPIKRSNDNITEECRELFPDEVVDDIADQIKVVTDRGTDTVFFMPPDAFWDFVKAAACAVAVAGAASVAAKSSALNTEEPQSSAGTPQNSE